MSGIPAGKNRHKVELQEPQSSQDPETGEITETWVRVAYLRAEIVPMSAREFIAAGAEQSELRGRMTVRYSSRITITSAMRIIHRGMSYNILGVLPDAESGKEHLTLMTGEGVRYNP